MKGFLKIYRYLYYNTRIGGLQMRIKGTVTIDLADYHLLKSDSEKWENALKVADEIRCLHDRINRSEMGKYDICKELERIEINLREGY